MIPDLQAFAGNWALSRSIDDRKGGQTGSLTGRATFTPGGKGLIYKEEGEFRLGAAAPIRATRSYLWRPMPGGGIAVAFEDGRPFHTIAAAGEGAAGPRATHWCDPDTYRVQYDFTDWPRWTSVWIVSGPAKDYTLYSTYTRAHAAA